MSDLLTDLKERFTEEAISGSGPKYLRVKRAIRGGIEILQPGTKIPTIREFADCFNVTQPPVQRAINELVTERVIVSKPRHGIFIANQITPELEDRETGLVREIVFKTGCFYPSQRRFWNMAINEFEKTNRYIKIVHKEVSRRDKIPCDISEKSMFPDIGVY